MGCCLSYFCEVLVYQLKLCEQVRGRWPTVKIALVEKSQASKRRLEARNDVCDHTKGYVGGSEGCKWRMTKACEFRSVSWNEPGRLCEESRAVFKCMYGCEVSGQIGKAVFFFLLSWRRRGQTTDNKSRCDLSENNANWNGWCRQKKKKVKLFPKL